MGGGGLRRGDAAPYGAYIVGLGLQVIFYEGLVSTRALSLIFHKAFFSSLPFRLWESWAIKALRFYVCLSLRN